MIKIENTQVTGWEAAIRGMRNPKNSWDRSDSRSVCDMEGVECSDGDRSTFILGEADYDLAMRLTRGGATHAKYRRMITVYVDITAPLYWWKEFDTYKIGTVSNSCSTMHKLTAKPFELADFSHDKLVDGANETLVYIVDRLNYWRELYLAEDDCDKKKVWWWQMIQLLPSSYNQKRTIMLNYEVLSRIYFDRLGHKLDEWLDFCSWIRELPYQMLITGERSWWDIGVDTNDIICHSCGHVIPGSSAALYIPIICPGCGAYMAN